MLWRNHNWHYPVISPHIAVNGILNYMKTLKCDLCDVTADGETFEEWMQALHPHYNEAHPEVMSDPNKTREDGERWMAENKARFETA